MSVQNLGHGDYAFWLPTSMDRFYPGFVRARKDGRVLVVEYKGDLWTDTADTREKAMIGSIWETRSKGRCIFWVVGRSDFETQVAEAILK